MEDYFLKVGEKQKSFGNNQSFTTLEIFFLSICNLIFDNNFFLLRNDEIWEKDIDDYYDIKCDVK